MAASEFTVEKKNLDNFDTEGCKGFTSNFVGPNSGEKPSEYHEKDFQSDRT